MRVAVPPAVGDQVTVSYAGDPPVTYRVSKGVVEVEDQHAEEFLAAVPGAKPAPAQ